MKIDVLRLFTAADKLGELDKLSDARNWTMTTVSQADLPVDSVSWSLKNITDVVGTFSFENGGSHILVLSQDALHADEESIEYDGAATALPHVSVRVTTVGFAPMKLAIIVKSGFSTGGESKQYRFDCHIPIVDLGDVIRRI